MGLICIFLLFEGAKIGKINGFQAFGADFHRLFNKGLLVKKVAYRGNFLQPNTAALLSKCVPAENSCQQQGEWVGN